MLRPEIPVGDLAIEVVGERVGVETFLPSFVETDEIRDAEVCIEISENEVVEDFNVGTDRIGNRDILD